MEDDGAFIIVFLNNRPCKAIKILVFSPFAHLTMALSYFHIKSAIKIRKKMSGRIFLFGVYAECYHELWYFHRQQSLANKCLDDDEP